MAKFIQKGSRIDYTPVAAVAAGDVIVVGDLVCVATGPIAAGETGSLAIEGVFEFDKDGGSGGTAFAQGERVDYDAGGAKIVPAEGTAGTRQAGFVFAPAAAGDLTVQVKLQPAGVNVGSGS